MDIMELHQLVSLCRSETDAFDYLFKKKKEQKGNLCPRCNSQEFYFMSSGRLRCSSCKTDYNPFNKTSFSGLRISCVSWLLLIKLFELEISARKASIQLGLSYPTTLKGFDILRSTILRELSRSDEVLRGEIEADESYFGGKRKGKRGRGAGGKTIVFGILERGGKVAVNIVKDVSAETLINETVTKVRRGSIVYTDKWKGYDSLMFCGYRHLNIDHGYRFKQAKICINGVEGFWSFAKERLIKHHGISKNKFLLYIKEMEWRYNNRDYNLFDLLVKYMLGADNL
jgi:transposase